jgi:TPR repeat protein
VIEGNVTINDDAAVPAQVTDGKPAPEDPSLPENEPSAKKPSAQKDSDNKEPATAAAASSREPDPQVELAQRYLQGRGVAQDCARGVSLLRTAAGKASTRARIQLGALYATGQCVTQDRVSAYRWFAQAQELDPENSYVSRNMNSLWSLMSREERRRAENP